MRTGDKRATQDEVDHALALYQENPNYYQVGKLVGRSHATIRFWVLKISKGKGIIAVKRGRPKNKVSPPEKGYKTYFAPSSFYATEFKRMEALRIQKNCKRGPCWLCREKIRLIKLPETI